MITVTRDKNRPTPMCLHKWDISSNSKFEFQTSEMVYIKHIVKFLYVPSGIGRSIKINLEDLRYVGLDTEIPFEPLYWPYVGRCVS